MNTFYIAKSGFKGATLIIILFALSLLFDFKTLAMCFLLLFGFWIFIFRNPERILSHLPPDAFLSPIDGVIENIYTKDQSTIIEIRVRILDVGLLRAPYSANQYQVQNIYGAPLYFSKHQKTLSPIATLQTPKYSLEVRQDLFHITPFAPEAQSLERGERIGFLKAGILRIQTQDLQIKSNIGDTLKGGESIIGYLQ